jgi:hypothetical protein
MSENGVVRLMEYIERLEGRLSTANGIVQIGNHRFEFHLYINSEDVDQPIAGTTFQQRRMLASIPRVSHTARSTVTMAMWDNVQRDWIDVIREMTVLIEPGISDEGLFTAIKALAETAVRIADGD